MKPLTILLAEDNVDHAELMVETLKSFNVGNKIVHVTNGELVIDYLDNKAAQEPSHDSNPDLILLDLKMPRMDGAATIEAIRQRERYKKTPIVMISTSTVDKEINRCYELGANSYVTKPLQFEEFSKKIRDLNLYWVLTSELPS